MRVSVNNYVQRNGKNTSKESNFLLKKFLISLKLFFPKLLTLE